MVLMADANVNEWAPIVSAVVNVGFSVVVAWYLLSKALPQSQARFSEALTSQQDSFAGVNKSQRDDFSGMMERERDSFSKIVQMVITDRKEDSQRLINEYAALKKDVTDCLTWFREHRNGGTK